MFTGIVERVGEIVSITETATGKSVIVAASGLDDVALGASISVNGVCLTAIEPVAGAFRVDVIPETLNRTNLGSLTPGESVNLERAMPAGGRFDGHIVQGHVDGTGEVSEISSDSEGGVRMTIELAPDLMRYIVEKGSITVDGVSLTVAEVGEGAFTVALIPHTLDVTVLGLRKVGDVVNLEVDVLAKYVERLIGRKADL